MFVLPALFSALALTASQQDRPAQTSDLNAPTEVEEITVEGRRTREAAQEFVRTLSTAPAGARLGRWSAPVCISVAGIRAPYGQAMVDRIAQTALDLGLGVGEPGCTPNVLIIATDDGPGVASALVEKWRPRFRPPIDNSNMGLAALERFKTSTAPIRWWHLSLPVSVDTGQPAARVSGGEPPVVAVRNLSRMRSSIRYDLTSVTVVLDLAKTENVSLTAMIDYTAMVVLAQVDPRADYSNQSTVLNLFNDPEGVTGLTAWDRDYLKALYTAEPDRATAAGQQAAVAERIIAERRDRARAEKSSTIQDADRPNALTPPVP